MAIIVIIPLLIGLILLFFQPAERIFLNLYLPVMLLLPIYYYWKSPLLPQLDFSLAALIPLGLAMVVRELPRWRMTLSDAAMILFVLSAGAHDLVTGDVATARQLIIGSLLSSALPYMAGKVLIEPKGLRAATAKRICFLLFCACIPSLWEYRMGSNLYSDVFSRFFPDESAWQTQFRWGFGRVAGPWGQSELAGIVLITGVVLSLWLSRAHLWETHFRGIGLPHRKGRVIGGMLAFTLLATQARGPWIGCLFALPVAALGFARNLRRSSIIVALVLIVGGSVTYVSLKAYSSGSAANIDQQDAVYRQHLLDNYTVMAKAGGPWGYGKRFPVIDGQTSIDNEYLYIALTQGSIGLFCFSWITLESIAHLLRVAYASPPGRDRSFTFAMLGIYAGITFTIATVFLGTQTYQLFFLLAGWSQALPRPEPEPVPDFAYVLS